MVEDSATVVEDSVTVGGDSVTAEEDSEMVVSGEEVEVVVREGSDRGMLCETQLYSSETIRSVAFVP